MTNVWGLWLGAEAGAEGWLRARRFWREGLEISRESFRRWKDLILGYEDPQAGFQEARRGLW